MASKKKQQHSAQQDASSESTPRDVDVIAEQETNLQRQSVEVIEEAVVVVADALELESVIGGPQGRAYLNASRLVRGFTPTLRSVTQ